MTVKITPVKLYLADEALPQIAAIAKDLMLIQLSQGIDGLGVQHLHADGTHWDFRDSGLLVGSMVVAWKDGKVIIVFAPEYATHIDTGAPLTLSPMSRQLLAERITPIAKKYVFNKR